MRGFILVGCCIVAHTLFAGGDIKYPVAEIPDSLKRNNYAVIREQESIFRIDALNKSFWYNRTVITILNNKARHLSKKAVPYDRDIKILALEGIVYDAAGHEIKRLKKSEIKDQSNISDFSLYEDGRIKFIDLSQHVYPYTIEIKYELQMGFTSFVPDFELYTDDEISIQKSSYRIDYRRELAPRYKTYKISNPKIRTLESGFESLEWTFENIIPPKWEPYSPPATTFVPHIKAAASQFEHGGYQGNQSLWDSYGKWQLQLNKGRDWLPEATIATIRVLTDTIPSIEAKVKAVYEFVQNKTRYVSIQLGIGGWQPFEAKTVDQLGYGDCKALSNYTIALLKGINVRGYYVKIRAGEAESPIDPEFPENYFNHIVVAVPNQEDTIWLECTSQTNPFGYSGSFTGNRKALLITDSGGKLVNTPYYSASQNVQSRTADINLALTGSANSSIRAVYSGLQYETNGLDYFINQAKEKQKEWLLKNIDIPNFDLVSFSMENKKDRIPTAIISARLDIRNLTPISGKRLFLTVNLMNKNTDVPLPVQSRKTNVYVNQGFVHRDTLNYILPERVYPEFIPKPIKISSRFGDYEAKIVLENNKLTYIRVMKMNDGTYPPESYNELIEFKKSINKADNTKVVFVNKT